VYFQQINIIHINNLKQILSLGFQEILKFKQFNLMQFDYLKFFVNNLYNRNLNGKHIYAGVNK